MAERVVVGSDHGAFDLKARVITHLKTRGFEVTDIGTSGPEPVDYRRLAQPSTAVCAAGTLASARGDSTGEQPAKCQSPEVVLRALSVVEWQPRAAWM